MKIKGGIFILKKEEVELLPEGLTTCILNNREVRILKISPDEMTVRLIEKEQINSIKVCFYNFEKYEYKKVEVDNYKVIEEKEQKFYYEYTISIENEEFSNNVRRVFRDYSRYIMLKNYGEENEFSEDMTGYPKDKDMDYYEFYTDQKKGWMESLESYSSVERDLEPTV